MNVDTAINLRVIGYLLFLVTPFVAFFVKGISKKALSISVKYALSIVVMYLFIIGPLFNLNYQLDGIVIMLDKDADGFITPDEEATWTEDEVRANKIWVGDGGRNVFGYLVSPIFAAIYTAVVFFVIYTGYWLVSKIGNRSSA